MHERQEKLERFLSELPVDAVVQQTARQFGKPETEVASLLQTFSNEARVTLDVVGGHLSTKGRLLEVGAGLCLFSLFLKQEGFNITALEPALGGFGVFDVLRRSIIEHYPGIDLQVLAIPAAELNAETHGHFDLIFSNNVVEHIPDWQEAFRAMLCVLRENGMMLHACPNYSVPYDPHYGVPVLRRLPRLSRRLFLPAGGDMEIWQSLNFICHRQVRCFAAAHDCSIVFKKGQVHQALVRLKTDDIFRQRHQGMVTKVADVLDATGLLRLLRYLPPAMATPMTFEMRHLPQNA
ncbi:MAG: methyltransferase domain-containing protein [Mariprofundaceae bacterium]|nr:methyltransferase domain-containing protein [Mariprofundaceae bacterium]